MVSLWSLYMTGRVSPPEPSPQVPPAPAPPAVKKEEPPPDPNVYLKNVRSINEFSRADEPDSHQMKYGFIDHHGKLHRVSCIIKKIDHDQIAGWYGYDEIKLDAVVDGRLQRIINKELSRRALTDYMTVRYYGRGGYRWNYKLPANMSSEETALKLTHIQEIVALLKNDLNQEADRIIEEEFMKRGFLVRNNVITIDYNGVIARAEDSLLNCTKSIFELGKRLQ